MRYREPPKGAKVMGGRNHKLAPPKPGYCRFKFSGVPEGQDPFCRLPLPIHWVGRKYCDQHRGHEDRCSACKRSPCACSWKE